jgi:hypothetical protein
MANDSYSLDKWTDLIPFYNAKDYGDRTGVLSISSDCKRFLPRLLLLAVYDGALLAASSYHAITGIEKLFS